MAKVLCVEDNDDSAFMLKARLQRQGYEVVIAVDGEQGVSKAQLEAQFGTAAVAQALALLEDSINGSPAKIPVMAAANKEAHGDLLRRQEDRLLSDLEAVLGGGGLAHLEDLIALLHTG